MVRLNRLLVVMLGLCSYEMAHAQNVPPFFNGGVGVFDPEISVVNSGAILDAQAVVSQDRRWVTITARPTNTRLLALQSYATSGPLTNAPLGFAGGANPFGTPTPAAVTRNHLTPTLRDSPAAVQAGTAGVLERRGRTRILP